ncbi:DotH/IcmK family type IV secretion protein [Legionella israelensis]|uniref:IcmK protein n=1 Tax=Legionella israelensis TaxID=454 RepID=A0A0W0W8N9_9GAMM|nr:DotH/IcmK family type IV secretion protein [Legionella israelensis]KTD28716.1 IcmK protein [Legionella israelensis]QBS09380.1 type IV secretion protein IcmK [Legionella israelensis]QDP71772.1 type IV secretion protein IcmK [Legionella israelensis]SCX88811.1 intracellular multiplication protein IcmK [Legionella israelensis DSM 19235]STX60280.1 IcmK protein [Legionella israelensis]
MKKKLIIIKIILICLLFFNVSIMHAAEQADSAQQALEQLRLLQKRLSQDAGQNAQPPQAEQQQGAAPAPAQPAPQTQQNETETVSPDAEKIIENKAFKDMARQLFPLSPSQLLQLKQLYHSNEFAKASSAGTPPKPTATSQFVNLSPGSTPPAIRLAQGFVSSLVFLDSTGAPWPISAYDLGDPSSFNIQWDKTSNTLMIQALKLYTYGNLAVRLRGLNTPVMLTLIPGQKAVDYRVDLRIQGLGPNAKSLPTEEGIPPAASDILLHVLDGVPPPNSQRLTVSGGDARAWTVNDKMYVRTNLTILSPGWIASMTSADGMHAYEMHKSPVLLVSWHGKVMQLKVEGL